MSVPIRSQASLPHEHEIRRHDDIRVFTNDESVLGGEHLPQINRKNVNTHGKRDHDRRLAVPTPTDAV